MKKIPAGAEACNVLVGEADFLSRPTVAFVRLSPAVLLSGLAEVPIATRYVAKIYSKCSSGDLGIWGLRGVKTWKFGYYSLVRCFYYVSGGDQDEHFVFDVYFNTQITQKKKAEPSRAF